MTSPDISAALVSLGWSQRELARQLGVAESSVRQWLTGKARMRPALAAWLTDLARYHIEHPAPERPFIAQAAHAARPSAAQTVPSPLGRDAPKLVPGGRERSLAPERRG